MDPEDTLFSICKAQGLGKPSSWKKVTTGLFNETFVVEIPGISKEISTSRKDANDAIIIRIAPRDDSGFIFYEKHMMRQEPTIHQLILEQTTIPVPRIYKHDFSREVIDRDYMVMELMQGISMSDAHFLSPAQVNGIYEEVGGYLRQAHEIHGKQHGYSGAHAPCPTKKAWFEAFRLMWQYLLDDLVSCGAYSKDDAAQFRQALEHHAMAFKRNPPPSLLHMDIWSQNILVNESSGKVTGIIDWDRSLTGDPEIEFAVLDYCGFNNPYFWKSYGAVPEIDNNYQTRMIFYLLYEHQKYIVINSTRRHDPMAVARYKRQSLNILQDLETGG